MSVVETSLPGLCEVCRSDGVVLLRLPGTRVELVTDCPHCGPAHIPIVKESKTK